MTNAITKPDTNQILRQALMRAGTPFRNLIGTRMHAGRLPKSPTYPALSYVSQGGDTDQLEPVYQRRYKFMCYGASETIESASVVYNLLSDELQGTNKVETDDGVLMGAWEEIPEQPIWDDDLERWQVFGSFMVEFKPNE